MVGFLYLIIKFLNILITILLFRERTLENLALDRELMAYKHNGFWQCMDTLRDKIFLDEYFKKKK